MEKKICQSSFQLSALNFIVIIADGQHHENEGF